MRVKYTNKTTTMKVFYKHKQLLLRKMVTNTYKLENTQTNKKHCHDSIPQKKNIYIKKNNNEQQIK